VDDRFVAKLNELGFVDVERSKLVRDRKELDKAVNIKANGEISTHFEAFEDVTFNVGTFDRIRTPDADGLIQSEVNVYLGAYIWVLLLRGLSDRKVDTTDTSKQLQKPVDARENDMVTNINPDPPFFPCGHGYMHEPRLPTSV